MKNLATVEIHKYPSNWSISVNSVDAFSGHILADFDWYDDEERYEYAKIIEKIQEFDTIEEIKQYMDKESILWNCTTFDYTE